MGYKYVKIFIQPEIKLIVYGHIDSRLLKQLAVVLTLIGYNVTIEIIRITSSTYRHIRQTPALRPSAIHCVPASYTRSTTILLETSRYCVLRSVDANQDLFGDIGQQFCVCPAYCHWSSDFSSYAGDSVCVVCKW